MPDYAPHAVVIPRSPRSRQQRPLLSVFAWLLCFGGLSWVATRSLPSILTTTSSTRTYIGDDDTLHAAQVKQDAIVVCVHVNDDAAYLDEWADYHLGLGVDHLYVYDQSGELGPFGEERLAVEVVPYLKSHEPASVYRACARKALKDGRRWVWFASVDEFLCVRANLTDFLSTYRGVGGVAIEGRVMGTAGRAIYEPIPVAKRFQARVESAQYPSALYELERLCLECEHFPSLSLNATLGDSRRFNGSSAAVYNFFYKSEQEFRHRHGDNATAIHGTRFDDTIWQALKCVSPRYAVFDEFYHG